MAETAKENNVVKAGIWYTISSIAVKAVLILTTPLFTRMMPKADFGIAGNFTSWFTMLNVVCSLNLWYSIGRAKLDYPGKLDEFVGSMQLLALCFMGVVAACTAPFLDRAAALLNLDRPLMIALLVYLAAYPAVQLNQAKFKYTYRYRGNIFITAYTTVVTVALSLLLVLLLPGQAALGKSLGAVVSTLLLSLWFWLDALKKRCVRVNTTYWRYALKITVPLILNSISLTILAQADRVLITKYCGAADNAVYTLAYNYAILINIILTAVNEAWLPWFHDSLDAGKKDDIRRNVKPLVLLGCWIGLGCVAIAPEAIALLGGSGYMEGVWAVPPITLGVVCSYIFQHYEHIELHLKRTWYISAGTVFAAGLNILLNILFIPRYGFVAAAYTTLACYLVLMVAHHIISRWVMKVHLYDDRYMYGALLITALGTAGFAALYGSAWYLRWGIIAVISAALLYKNRALLSQALHAFLKK